ncbi:MAG TPA: hypothetical protein VE326_01245 [Candidatus Binatia bacterium]|nr:hypothetical protein [Candidatus Binatia bacterium]
MQRSPSPRVPRIVASAVAVAMALAGPLALTGLVAPPASAAPSCDAGAARRSAWTFSWRPGWLPGDPVPAEGANLLAPPLPGIWIALDPVTRRPTRPTAEQRRAAQAALAPAAPEMDETLPVERIPGGGEMIHLNGRHMVFEVARRDASGRFRTSCASDSATATRVLSTPVSAAREAK